MGQNAITGLLGRLLFQLLDKLRGVHAAGHADKMLHGLTIQLSLFPLELGDDLIDLVLDLLFVFQHLETVQQLSKGSRWVGYHRFHGIDRFQRFIDTDRVINLKMGLMNLGTQAGGTTQHLFKQNAGFYPAQEHQIGDLRHIDTGSQQVHSDSNAGITLILKPFDGFLYLFGIAAAHAAGDLHNCVIVYAVFRVDILEDVHDHVGMLVIHGIDKDFPGRCLWRSHPELLR